MPESRLWWDRERKNLYASTEDHAKGMMTGMVTLTQNDRAPELLAHVQSGDEEVVASGMRRMLFAAAGDDPYELLARAFRAASAALGTGTSSRTARGNWWPPPSIR